MFNIIERLKGAESSPQLGRDASDLLASCSLPNPNDLRRKLSAIESQLRADDAAWERLDRTSNPRAFAEQQSIAARRGSLETQRETLRRQLAATEKSRAAFVALTEMIDALDHQIAEAAQRLYADFLTAEKDDRRVRLQSLDGLVRARARIAAPLRDVSTAPKFRRAPDPFTALAHDLRARADEIERLRGPGMPRPAAPPPRGSEDLIAALYEGKAV